MIRPLRPFDAARFALLGRSTVFDRAYTLDSVGSDEQSGLSKMAVARLSLSARSRVDRWWTLTDGNGIVGMAAARPRSGPRAWEVAHLLMARDYGGQCSSLLRSLCQEAAARGGERVFIRLRSGDAPVEAANLGGFLHCADEVLYGGWPPATASGRPIDIRERRPSDNYGLFRLYTATTPLETRLSTAVTFGQWASSRERTRGRVREYVYEKGGQPAGWAKTISRSGDTRLLVMLHPAEENNLSALVDQALAPIRRTSRVYCLAGEHQALLQRLLLQRGYEALARYVTLVKSMVAPVVEKKAHRAVEMASP